MFVKLVDWIGRRANSLIVTLALIVAANVLVQLYMHKTTPLTAWKGGGFGMYTEPHAEARGVWAQFSTPKGSAYVQLWPEGAALAQWRRSVSPKAADFINGLVFEAERFRYYPTSSAAQKLARDVGRVRWPTTLSGGLVPANGKTFKGPEVSIQVFENDMDLATSQVNRTQVFAYVGGGS